MSRYIISPAASQDLDEIIDTFLQGSIEAGERFLEKFNRKCRNLIQFPQMGRSYEDLAPGLRGIPLEGYIILYRLAGGGIEIVRVVSGYRDLPALFSTDE